MELNAPIIETAMDLEPDGLYLNPSFTVLGLRIRARHLVTVCLSICICKIGILLVPQEPLRINGQIKWHHVYETYIDINILSSSFICTEGHISHPP